MAANTASNFNLGTGAAINGVLWKVTYPSTTTTVPGFTYTLNSTPQTTSINLIADSTVPPGEYTLTATSQGYSYNGNSCQGAITKTINVAPPAPTFVTPLTNCVIKGTTQVTSIQAVVVAGATYSWDITGAPGWQILAAGNTTATPTFIPSGNTAGPVTIKVKRTGTNGCDSSQASLNVSYYAIVGNFQPSPFSDQYALSCGTADSWTINGGVAFTAANLPPNVTILNSNTTLSIGGNNGTPITAVCANVLINGVSTPICATTFGSHTAARQSSIPKIGGEKLEVINIYPNPNKGEFIINVTDYKHAVAAIITDSLGKELGTYELTKGENKLTLSKLAKGVYFVTLLKDGKSEVRQIIIE
jgi:Secretion system C-terminal sorting domain